MPYPYNKIPPYLMRHRHWVVWGVGDATPKAPFSPAMLLLGEALPAKAGVPETWGRYDNAVECVRRGLAQGIGYQFGGTDLYGVDLDHVLDERGQLAPQAHAIVDKLASYTEVSPSGTGLHIFVFAPGADITRHRKKDGFVEIYNDLRYFTVTGNVYGAAKDIERRPAELQSIHDEYLLPSPAQRTADVLSPVSMQSSAEQERFLRMGLERDKTFATLWAGERRNGNESSDDQALMNKLAYWCSADPAVMIRAFMRSPHYAQKDEAHKKKCLRCDYLPNTAKAACATVYSTAIADYERWQQNRRHQRSHAR